MTATLPRAQRRSRFALDWSPRFCLDQVDCALAAITGQAATFTRAATATAADAAGVTQTFAHSQPAFEWNDLDADAVRESVGQLLGTSDRLFLAYPAAAAARTLLIDFTDKTATGAANGSRVLEIGDSAGNGWISIQRSAAGFSALHRNGTTTVTATTTVTVASGDRITLRAVLTSTGTIQIWSSKNGGAEQSNGATAANTITAWNQPQLSIGADYAGANRATQTVYRVRDIAGTQTAAFMLAG